MSPDVAHNIVDRYTRGQSTRFIGFALDLSQARVRRTLVDHGVAVRGGAVRWRQIMQERRPRFLALTPRRPTPA
jgi:hypothetical protein